MIALILLLILVALILGGSYYWAQRQPQATAGGITTVTVKRQISLVTEATAYVGGVLLVAGGGTAIGQR